MEAKGSESKIRFKDMNLEGYIKYYNETLYPLNYPYYLKHGIRASIDNSKPNLSIIVQIGIPKECNLYGSDWDIDKPAEYDFQDLIEVYGDTDEEVINIINNISWDINHKEYFKKLWTYNEA